jgi:cell division protein FtsI/penicillin-binding protein 2
VNASRIRFLRWGFVLLFSAISARLVWIQVFESSSLREQARTQSRQGGEQRHVAESEADAPAQEEEHECPAI